MPVLPEDNVCEGANDINSLFGGAVNTPMVSDLFDNTGHTSVGDPTAGFECLEENPGTLESTIWFSFTGDGGSYQIRSVNCTATNPILGGDTQAAIYSGDCINPTPVACNEDEDFSSSILNVLVNIETVSGTEYMMFLDGYNGLAGEFCVEVTRFSSVDISDLPLSTIELYPNPTEGIVRWNGVIAQSVEVYDNTGRVVLTAGKAAGMVDVSSLTEGIYTLKIYADDGVYTARVVRQ